MKVYLRSDEGHEEEMELVPWNEFSTVRDIVMDMGEEREKFVVPCHGHSTRAITDVLNWCTRLTPERTSAVWDLLHLLQPSKLVMQHWVSQLDRSTYSNILSKQSLEWLWEVDKEWQLADEQDPCAKRIREMLYTLSGVNKVSGLHLEWVAVNRYTNANISAKKYLELLSMKDWEYVDWLTPEGYVCSAATTPQGIYTGYRETLEVLRAMNKRYIAHNVITSSVAELGKDVSLKMMWKYLGEKVPPISSTVYLSCLLPFWTDLLELCIAGEKKDLLRYTARSCVSGHPLVRLLFRVAITCQQEWHSCGDSLPLSSSKRANSEKYRGSLTWRLGACLMDSDAYSTDLVDCMRCMKIDF